MIWAAHQIFIHFVVRQRVSVFSSVDKIKLSQGCENITASIELIICGMIYKNQICYCCSVKLFGLFLWCFHAFIKGFYSKKQRWSYINALNPTWLKALLFMSFSTYTQKLMTLLEFLVYQRLHFPLFSSSTLLLTMWIGINCL